MGPWKPKIPEGVGGPQINNSGTSWLIQKIPNQIPEIPKGVGWPNIIVLVTGKLGEELYGKIRGEEL